MAAPPEAMHTFLQNTMVSSTRVLVLVLLMARFFVMKIVVGLIPDNLVRTGTSTPWQSGTETSTAAEGAGFIATPVPAGLALA